MQSKVDLLKRKERTWDLYLILLYAYRSKMKGRRGRTLGGQIVSPKDTSFCWWNSPSPLLSVLSVKLICYRTSDDVKNGTASELESSSSESISLSADVTKCIAFFSLSLIFSGKTRNEERETWVLVIPLDRFRPIPKKSGAAISYPARPANLQGAYKTHAQYRPVTSLCGSGRRSRSNFAISISTQLFLD